MKTKIVFEDRNENYMEKVNQEDLDKEIEKVLYLSLLKKDLISQKQYEECIKRM